MDGRQRNDVMITDIDRNPQGPENNIHRDYLIIIVKIHQIKTLKVLITSIMKSWSCLAASY